MTVGAADPSTTRYLPQTGQSAGGTGTLTRTGSGFETGAIDYFSSLNAPSAPGFQTNTNQGPIVIPPELYSLVNSSNGAITIQTGNNGEITGIDFTTDFDKVAQALIASVGTSTNPITNAVDLFGLIQRERLQIPISINGELQGIEEQSTRLIGSTDKLISKNKVPYSFAGTYAETMLSFFESMSVPGNPEKYFGSAANYQRVKNSITDAATALEVLAKTAADGTKNAKDGITKGGEIATTIAEDIAKISSGGGAGK